MLAFTCLAAGGLAFWALPQGTEGKPRQKPFKARLFKSEPVSAAPKPAPPRAQPKPTRRKKATKRSVEVEQRAPARQRRGKVDRAEPAARLATDQGPVGAEWESSVQYYSGGSYGVEHINKHSLKQGDGGYPGDRLIISRAAAKYGIPFRLLWGTYGAESSWGQNTGGGELPPYFGLTHSYPGRGQTRYRGTSGNFQSDAEKSARSWMKIYRLKNGGVSP